MNDPFAHEIRQAAASIVPQRSFLRRDRESALFVTNAPRIDPGRNWPELFEGIGFDASEENGLVRLIPGNKWISRLEQCWKDAPDHLCQTFIRFRGMVPDEKTRLLFALGVRILDGDSVPDYEERLRKCAAICLRTSSGGGLYGCGILNHLIKRSQDI